MLAVVCLVGLLIVGLGFYGLVAPTGLIRFARSVVTRKGLWAAFLFRLVLAAALYLAADASRTPTAYRVLAVLTLIGALAIPALGETRANAMVEWWSGHGDGFVRAWSLIAIALGAFLVWSSVMGQPAIALA